MKVYGIIGEFNPFHWGHNHLVSEINRIKEEKLIVGIISSSFVQRGEPAILSKWDRTKIALDAGINLVVELPFVFACQNAEIFSKGSLKILDSINISHLAFGTESSNIENLIKIANKLIKPNEELDLEIKKELLTGESFIRAKNDALLKLDILTNEEIIQISKPNNILALEYIKAILEENYKISPISIPRVGVDHDSTYTNNKYSSASNIRNLYKNNVDIRSFLPEYSYAHYENYNIYNEYILLSLIRYNFIVNESFIKDTLEYEKGLENRIYKYLNSAKSFEDLSQMVSNKRITKARIRRILIASLLKVTKEDVLTSLSLPPYIRILGMDEKGATHLKGLNIPYINKFAFALKNDNPINNIAKIEVKTSNLYSILNDLDYNLDFTKSPIFKSK